MPHQCVHCSKIYPDGSEELLKGCSCSSHFFFYLRQEQIEKINEKKEPEKIPLNLSEEDKIKIEKDIREIMEVPDEDIPVILDLESIRVLGPGKFEIDIVNLFNTKRPIIYKLEEGKYIIDLASTFRVNLKEKNESKQNI